MTIIKQADLIESIREALQFISYYHPVDFVQAVANKHVDLTLDRIRERSPILRGMADKGEIGLAGAMYDVHTGQVTFT